MPVAVAIILAGIAGAVDALSQIRDGAFVANMTGNTVFLAIAVARETWEQAAKSGSAIAAFVVGAVIARRVLRRMASPRCGLALTVLALLAAAALHGMTQLVVLAAAMGLQDAAAMQFGRISINTVFITGDLVALSDAVAGLSTAPRSSGHKAASLGGVWLGYVAGAALGAIAAPLPVPQAFDPRFAAAALAVGAIAVFAPAPQEAVKPARRR